MVSPIVKQNQASLIRSIQQLLGTSFQNIRIEVEILSGDIFTPTDSNWMGSWNQLTFYGDILRTVRNPIILLLYQDAVSMDIRDFLKLL